MRSAAFIISSLAFAFASFTGVAAPVAASPTSAPPKGPFEIKSGIVEWTDSSAPGTKTTLYFDDHGAKQAVRVVSTDATRPYEGWTVDADGSRTSWDALAKTGRRLGLGGLTPIVGAWLPPETHMPEAVRASIRELPPRKVAGKTASGIEVEVFGVTMREWSWKKIPLYGEAEIFGKDAQPRILEVTSIKEAKVPPSTFKVPAAVAIVETP